MGELTLDARLPSGRCTNPAPATKLEIGVSLASPLAVMVVGKKTVAPPLVFFGEKPFLSKGEVGEANGNASPTTA